MERFNEYALSIQNEEFEGKSNASDLDWSSGIQIALTNAWQRLSKLKSKYIDSGIDGSEGVVAKANEKKEEIISDFESISDVLSNYRESAIIQQTYS